MASPDVAIEDGVLRVKHGSAEAAVVKRFTAIWVRQGDVWLLDAVRELAHPATSPKNPLDGLAWMVGDWRSERGEKTIQLSCRWSDDKHFLLLEIDANPSQRDSLHVTQRIGWDARERQIKCERCIRGVLKCLRNLDRAVVGKLGRAAAVAQYQPSREPSPVWST